MSADVRTVDDIINSVAQTHRISISEMMQLPPDVLKDLVSFENLMRKRESWAKTLQQLNKRAENVAFMIDRLDDVIWRHPDNLIAAACKAGSLPATRTRRFVSHETTEDEEREQDYDDRHPPPSPPPPSPLPPPAYKKPIRHIQARDIYF